MYHKWIEFIEFLIYFGVGGLCMTVKLMEEKMMRVNLLY